MHKKGNLAKRLAREQSMMGWQGDRQLLRQKKMNILGELNQLHVSMGKGHHLARSMGGRNLALNKHREGRG